MPTYTQSWSPVTDGLLTFTNISVNEVNVGSVEAFVATASQPTIASGTEHGIQWNGFSTLTYGAESSQTLTFNYDVTSASGTELISSINSQYVIDTLFGTNAHLVATANVYNLNGDLIGSQYYSSDGVYPPASTFIQAQQAVHVTVTISQFIDAGDTDSAISASVFRQTFGMTNADQLCSIGDYVWLDLDGNGLQTAPSADPGLPTLTVQLMDATGTDVLLTTVTDDNGFYLFDNLQAGTYTIRFVTVDGFVFSPQDVGGDEAIDSDADVVTGITGPITLEAGDHVTNVDVGLVPDGSGAGSTASLGDYVWVDTNGNGIQDGTEAGLVGVTVNLMDSTGTTVLDTKVTDGSGQYAFTNLAAGTYSVQFVGPNGYVFTSANQTGDAADSDADTGTGLTGPITLTAGEVNGTVDAGVRLATGQIGNYVWVDSNGNGVQDGTETGLSGVTVNLMDSTGTTILGTQITNGTGGYLFTGLLAGTYRVEFENPTNYAFTGIDAGGNDLTDSDANTTTGLTSVITLTAGQSNLTVDAGLVFCPPANASIGNYVWYDCDNDGKQDAGESGIGGVTVQLMNAAGTGVLATTVTNSSGFYQFTGLNAGTYQVLFGTKAGYQLTAANLGTDDTIDSDANTSTRLSGAVTLTAGQNNTTVDAGMTYSCAPTTGSIGNFVWYDCDGDGKQDYGESGISGVTVKLMSADGNTVLATTTTSYNGSYQFTGLNAGTYQVYFGTKSGYALTSANQGTDDFRDSDADTSTRLSGPINLSAGENEVSIDAGMVQYCPASIGNFVWYDCDGDGKQDYGENGLSGVTVQLMDAAGTSVLATTTTSSSGYYQFSNLNAGTYQVYFGTKSGYVLTSANQGTDDFKDSDANTSTRLSGPIYLRV